MYRTSSTRRSGRSFRRRGGDHQEILRLRSLSLCAVKAATPAAGCATLQRWEQEAKNVVTLVEAAITARSIAESVLGPPDLARQRRSGQKKACAENLRHLQTGRNAQVFELARFLATTSSQARDWLGLRVAR